MVLCIAFVQSVRYRTVKKSNFRFISLVWLQTSARKNLEDEQRMRMVWKNWQFFALLCQWIRTYMWCEHIFLFNCIRAEKSQSQRDLYSCNTYNNIIFLYNTHILTNWHHKSRSFGVLPHSTTWRKYMLNYFGCMLCVMYLFLASHSLRVCETALNHICAAEVQ